MTPAKTYTRAEMANAAIEQPDKIFEISGYGKFQYRFFRFNLITSKFESGDNLKDWVDAMLPIGSYRDYQPIEPPKPDFVTKWVQHEMNPCPLKRAYFATQAELIEALVDSKIKPLQEQIDELKRTKCDKGIA